MDTDRFQELHSAVPAMELLVAAAEAPAIIMAADAEAIYGFESQALFEAAPRLRWIQAGSAGVDRYPLGYLRRRGIVLTNAAGIYGIQLADHTLALILAFSRQLPFLFRAQQKHVWVARSNFPSGELLGQRLLVVGLGGTGMETARRAQAFGLRVTAIRRKVDQQRPDFVESVHPPQALPELIPAADWIAVCVPLTRDTRDLFGDREFALMKSTARIICVTRGGIINTDALVRALKDGKIAGAGLDVTDPEPLPPGHPLWSMGNVILTPHSSGHSPRASERMFSLLLENARRFSEGRDLLNVVDLDLGY